VIAAKSVLAPAAIGGNSLIRAIERGTVAEQIANTQGISKAIVALVRRGVWCLAGNVTHDHAEFPDRPRFPTRVGHLG
jgi:hypothetical protein